MHFRQIPSLCWKIADFRAFRPCGGHNRSIFVKEVVLQERLLEISYNLHEKSEYVVILKNETSLYVTQWISVTMKFIQRKYFIYKQAA